MIQIELQPELEAQLAAEAQSRGMELEGYIQKPITERAAGSQHPSSSNRPAAIDELLEQLAAHSDKIPDLPDEAFTRESFYRDRR